MLTVLLIWVPFISGLISFVLPDQWARGWALITTLITLVIACSALWVMHSGDTQGLTRFDVSWIPQLGARFTVSLDGVSAMLSLLTTLLFPIIFIATWATVYPDTKRFFGLMLLTQAGLLGVFLSMDALLFYAFWELALIPIYFLCSTWGGERRIAVTFKFFVYTFLGSLLMLVGILYLHQQTPDHSFSWVAFTQLHLDGQQQSWLFWLFFVAFAIKMPLFPFHTWQPDTYEQAPAAVTMVLSAVMVKMGVFGLIRWILPVLPQGVAQWSQLAMILSITGILYASIIALSQNDLKKLVAYSSIAHIGLMSATLFARNEVGTQGVLLQMFNHGINITGMWIIVDIIERKTKTKTISDLGGIALRAPRLATAFVVICLANIALPLTNSFVGEFLMFTGLYQYSGWMMGFAGLAIILGAVYTLRMLQKVIFGEVNLVTATIGDLNVREWLAVVVVIGLILVVGIYPKPLLDLVSSTTHQLMSLTGN
ncbi:MAG: complex I subunit 4 family protein [Chitinophagaceae bacterium]